MTLRLRVIYLLGLLYALPALGPLPAHDLGLITVAEAQESVRVWVNTGSGCTIAQALATTELPSPVCSCLKPRLGRLGIVRPTTKLVAPRQQLLLRPHRFA